MKEWEGAVPTRCDICHKPIDECFIDGKTNRQYFPWAFMCLKCHAEAGCGLGLGLGQKYQRQGDKWVKVEDARSATTP